MTIAATGCVLLMFVAEVYITKDSDINLKLRNLVDYLLKTYIKQKQIDKFCGSNVDVKFDTYLMTKIPNKANYNSKVNGVVDMTVFFFFF